MLRIYFAIGLSIVRCASDRKTVTFAELCMYATMHLQLRASRCNTFAADDIFQFIYNSGIVTLDFKTICSTVEYGVDFPNFLELCVRLSIVFSRRSVPCHVQV